MKEEVDPKLVFIVQFNSQGVYEIFLYVSGDLVVRQTRHKKMKTNDMYALRQSYEYWRI